MKRVALLAFAMMMAGAVSSFAGSGTGSDQRDECLVAMRNCANQVDTIQEKISRLQTEINKGTKVYTPQELNTLKMKLNEEQKLMDDLLSPG